MVKYEIEQELAEISSTNTTATRLALVKWGDNPAKLDLRVWRTDTGNPNKGITLTNEEAQTLLDALADYLGQQQD